jgi:hypothetical protein
MLIDEKPINHWPVFRYIRSFQASPGSGGRFQKRFPNKLSGKIWSQAGRFKFKSDNYLMGSKMSIEVDIPKELELKIKASKELDVLVKKRIEHQISTDIKNDVFISMICDDLLMESELNEEDVDEIDHKIKKGIVEKLRWRS